MSDGQENTDDDLAAEYVLGVLEGQEREDVQSRIDKDINFARLVSSWEERLSGLNESFDEVTPPPSVKTAIESELFVAPIASGGMNGGMMGFMTRFRIPILLAVLVFAATPRVMDYLQGPAVPQVIYTSTIDALESYQVSFVAEVTDQGLSVTQTKGDKLSDKDYELWLVRADGVVLSLGVLSGELNQVGLEIAPDAKFAISVEPIGGSPTGVATGPVVALGTLKSV